MAVLKLAISLQLVLAALGQSPKTDVGLPLGGGKDPYAPAVERMVSALIEYSRWPAEKPVVRLCIVGPSDHSQRVASRQLRSGQELRVVRLATGTGIAGQCDAMYIGRLSLAEQIRATDGARNLPVLTIAENDPACRSRAMVCLLFESDALSFRLNIDSVSRSQVRIDPRVLRMGMAGER